MTPASTSLVPAPYPQPLLLRAEAALGAALDASAALLVVVEVLVLLAGVISRFVFVAPLIWTDELASSLFLWLAMLGGVIAARRSVHMRMSALTCKLSPNWQAFFDALGMAFASTFLLLLILPSVDYTVDQNFITSPALDIPDSWRAAALPVGLGLMLLVALLRLAASARPPVIFAALLTVAAIAAAMWFASPALVPLGKINLIVFFVGGVSLMVFAGVPIAFCFGLSTVAYFLVTSHLPLTIVIGRMDGGMSQLILLAVPLFVFLGALLEMTGMADVMVRFLSSLLGHVRGGLSYVLVGAMYLISGVSGAKAADMAAVAPVLFPEMQRRGARGGDLVALLAATGGANRDGSAQPGAHHHRLGNRRFDRCAVHRGFVAQRAACRRTLRDGLVASSQRRCAYGSASWLA